jgi:hypothetical protein
MGHGATKFATSYKLKPATLSCLVHTASRNGGNATVICVLADFYDPAIGGIFSCHPTAAQQQQLELLAGVDKQLTPEQQQQSLGPNGDGTISLEEAKAALDSLPRGKVPGSDRLTYEFYSTFWEQMGPAFVAACNFLFSQDAALLPPQQRMGLITLLFKGGGKPREQPASYRPITLLNCDVKIWRRWWCRGWGLSWAA